MGGGQVRPPTPATAQGTSGAPGVIVHSPGRGARLAPGRPHRHRETSTDSPLSTRWAPLSRPCIRAPGQAPTPARPLPGSADPQPEVCPAPVDASAAHGAMGASVTVWGWVSGACSDDPGIVSQGRQVCPARGPAGVPCWDCEGQGPRHPQQPQGRARGDQKDQPRARDHADESASGLGECKGPRGLPSLTADQGRGPAATVGPCVPGPPRG